MHKYNSRLLKALVVAYKRGIINKKPLKRWLNKEEVFYCSVKYLAYLILFSFLFIILNNETITWFDLDNDVIVGNLIIEKVRIVSGLILGALSFILFQLSKYAYQIYTVNKAMKQYIVSDGDIEQVNSITFKIHV